MKWIVGEVYATSSVHNGQMFSLQNYHPQLILMDIQWSSIAVLRKSTEYWC